MAKRTKKPALDFAPATEAWAVTIPRGGSRRKPRARATSPDWPYNQLPKLPLSAEQARDSELWSRVGRLALGFDFPGIFPRACTAAKAQKWLEKYWRSLKSPKKSRDYKLATARHYLAQHKGHARDLARWFHLQGVRLVKKTEAERKKRCEGLKKQFDEQYRTQPLCPCVPELFEAVYRELGKGRTPAEIAVYAIAQHTGVARSLLVTPD